MIQNRMTHGIPVSEDEIINVMYRNRGKSSFLSPCEIKRKSSDNECYSKRRKGVDYETFGEPRAIDY